MTALNLPAQSWPPSQRSTPAGASHPDLAEVLQPLARKAYRLAALLTEAREIASELGQVGLLRRTSVAPGTNPPSFQLQREGDFWTLLSDEGVHRLKHSRGLETLHKLVGHPDVEFHATDLAAEADGWQDIGDAGEQLDREARTAYGARLEDLREALNEAESFGDAARASRIRDEIAFLAAELSRAVGLSGRERRAGTLAERARVTVQKRIRQSIRKIEAASPRLGRHLATTIQTGTYCCYRPARRRLP
jgi:hypothetical protein